METGYPSRSIASTTGAVSVNLMTMSKMRKATPNPLRMRPVQIRFFMGFPSAIQSGPRTRHVVRRGEDRANFRFTLPARPVVLVELHELLRLLDRFFLGLQLEDCVSADDFLGLGKRTVGDAYLSAGHPHARAHRTREESAGLDQRAGLHGLDAQLRDRVHEPLRRGTGVLGGLDHRQESHCVCLLCLGSGLDPASTLTTKTTPRNRHGVTFPASLC